MSAEEDKNEEIFEPSQEDTTEANKSSSEEREKKLRDEMLYLRAEFENSKRRLIREQENAIRFANEKIISELVGIVDLFDRALGSTGKLKVNASDEVKAVLTGVEMTQRELTLLLNRFGVEFTGAVGEKFDPNRHEAVAQSPGTEEQVDTVLAVVQKGCTLQGRLLKPAKVVVGIAKE